MTDQQEQAQQTPLAFIYDRHATATKGILNIRVEECEMYAQRHGWEVAGRWIDEGHDALSDDRRPEFDAMCRSMQQFARSRPVICVTNGWDRFSRSEETSAFMRRRVLAARGYCVTTMGDSDKGQVSDGRLTTPALPT